MKRLRSYIDSGDGLGNDTPSVSVDDGWLGCHFVQFLDDGLLLSVCSLQFSKHHGLSFFKLFGDFVDVLSLHIGFRNPLSIKFGGWLIVILFSYVSRVLGSFLHLIQFLCISLFVFYVFDSVLLDGLSDFVLLFLYLKSLLRVSFNYWLLIVVDVRLYSHSVLVYSHTVCYLLLHHFFVKLLLRLHFLCFDVMHFF